MLGSSSPEQLHGTLSWILVRRKLPRLAGGCCGIRCQAANYFSCYFRCLMLMNVKVPVLSQASTSAVLWWLIASVGKSTEPQPGLENLLSSVLLSP